MLSNNKKNKQLLLVRMAQFFFHFFFYFHFNLLCQIELNISNQMDQQQFIITSTITSNEFRNTDASAIIWSLRFVLGNEYIVMPTLQTILINELFSNTIGT